MIISFWSYPEPLKWKSTGLFWLIDLKVLLKMLKNTHFTPSHCDDQCLVSDRISEWHARRVRCNVERHNPSTTRNRSTHSVSYRSSTGWAREHKGQVTEQEWKHKWDNRSTETSVIFQKHCKWHIEDRAGCHCQITYRITPEHEPDTVWGSYPT